MGNHKSETISMIEGMIEDLTALSCDSYEFMRALGYVTFQSEATKYLFRSIIEIVDRKRPKLIEMKRFS